MDWADELAAGVSGPQVVNDSKTPSGTVHVGSLRGPVILDVIARALRHAGLETTLLYGIDDLDPMDAQALLTPDAVEREMGRPLAHVPDPAGDCHDELRPPLRRALHRHVPRARDRPGPLLLDERHLPDRADGRRSSGPRWTGRRRCARSTAGSRTSSTRTRGCRSRSSARTAAGSGRRSSRTGTARRSRSSAGRTSSTWATGCGWTGRVSPFGGAAKLPWNLEWAAQWSLLGVTIEPCGKDLSTAGGSRDRSDAIAREVFEREPPLNVPYEFINIGGKKMSTSKGRGAAAHEIVEVIPPEQLRFFFLRPRRTTRSTSTRGDRRRAAPLRRVRQVRGGDGGQAGQGRPAAGLRGHVRLLAAGSRRRTSRRRRRRSGRPSATSPSSPRSRTSTSRPGSRRRRASR